jgi:hypothetical protein
MPALRSDTTSDALLLKHRLLLLKELERAREAVAEQKARADELAREKAAIVSRASLLSRELIDSQRANDTALRRLLLAGAASADGGGGARAAGRAAHAEPAVGAQGRSASVGALSAEPLEPGTRNAGDISLATAASQILLLRKEVKFVQKQWAAARRERDALKATASESQGAAARELGKLRAEAALQRQRLTQAEASRALLGREIVLLRQQLRYRVSQGAADAAAALLLLPPEKRRGRPKRATGASASASAAGSTAASDDEREYDEPHNLEEALALVRALRTDAREAAGALAAVSAEKTVLSQRLLSEQEERVALMSDNYALQQQVTAVLCASCLVWACARACTCARASRMRVLSASVCVCVSAVCVCACVRARVRVRAVCVLRAARTRAHARG